MRKLIIAIVCLCVLFVAAFGSYRGYKLWKQKRYVKMARQFIEKGDGANAMLSLRQVLQANPGNIEACRMMAEFAELAGSPQALLWRSRLVELEPKSFTNRLALARTAMAVGDTDMARKTLDGVDEPHKKTALFHIVSGAAELSAGALTEAEMHFVEASRIEPSNPLTHLNLASLRLQRKDASVVAEARASLQNLTTNKAVRHEALKHLVFDSLRQTNLPGALTFSRQLVQDSNSAFSDRMLRLDVLRNARDPELETYLATLKRESVSNSPKAFEVSKWILGSGKPNDALDWIRTLPTATRTNPPVPLVETDCYIATRNWSAMVTNLALQNWLEMDCLRLAARCRAFKEQGITAAAKGEWLAAMKAAGAGKNSNALRSLLRTVDLWRWRARARRCALGPCQPSPERQIPQRRSGQCPDEVRPNPCNPCPDDALQPGLPKR